MNPPSRSLRSTRATDHPALASSAADTRPFTPDPTTTASNVLGVSSPPRCVPCTARGYMCPDLLSVDYDASHLFSSLDAFWFSRCAIASVGFRVPLTSDSLQCFDVMRPIPPRYWSPRGAEAPPLFRRRGRRRALRAGRRAAARCSASPDAADTTARRRDRMRTLRTIEARRAPHRGWEVVSGGGAAAPLRCRAWRRPNQTRRSRKGWALARRIL